MHGEDTKVSKIRRQRLVTEIQQLQELKEQARPCDAFLFLRDPVHFYKTATVHKLASYVSTTKKAILRSVKRWKKRYDEGTVSLLGWLRDVENNQAAVRKLEEQQRIWEDGRKKERRRRTKRKIQKNTLNNYFFSLQTL